MALLDKIKRYGQSKLIEQKQKQVASALIQKKAQAEYYRTKEKEEMRFQREKARYETNERIKGLRTGKSGGFNSFLSGIAGSSAGKTSKNQIYREKISKPVFPIGYGYGGKKQKSSLDDLKKYV